MYQGQRQKRLEERRKRLEREEENKKKIDIEEAMFQAEKRKSAIEKAKLQQYYETDRIKGLHVSTCAIRCCSSRTCVDAFLLCRWSVEERPAVVVYIAQCL